MWLGKGGQTGTNCSATIVNGKTEYWGNSYGYDAWGNLLAKTVTKCSAESLSVTADANNHLQGGYTYDAAGNMLHDATANLNYSYDQENRITGAAGYTYTYDGDGNRVEKSNGSTGTLYWYMSPGIVAESDLGGDLKSEYVFFDGERVARKDFPGLAVSYYFSDHLKTTDIVTDASGNIENESDFYPWGGELEFLANDSNHYKFTGKERDTETGLDYFGARYYSNGLGRFITPDWAAKATAVPYAEFADPQSLNLYSYVRNVPTTRMDPDGHFDDPFGVHGHGLMTQRQIDERNYARLQAIDVATSCQMAMDRGCGSRQGTGSRAPDDDCFTTGCNLARSYLKFRAKWDYFWAWIQCTPFCDRDNPVIAADPFINPTGLPSMVKVGRWMSVEELKQMQATGRVVESRLNGVTSVTYPPNPEAYTDAAEGSRFVTFEVPASRVMAITENGWAKIYGPSSIFAKYYDITEMPEAKILDVLTKMGPE